MRMCVETMRHAGLAFVASVMAGICMADAPSTDEDPYLWLEDVEAEKALAWVREQNAASTRELQADPRFEAIRTRLLSVYESQARIPYVQKQGAWLYNFWRDASNVRGVWRRTTLAEYRKPEPRWETVLDLDALAQKENENWVWGGYECAFPDFTRCLIYLSRGGGDTVAMREFDVGTQQFVMDGFSLPAAKLSVSWRDRDTLYVGTDFGPGSLTTSGYPRILKSWKRGTPLGSAVTVFEGENTDVSVSGFVSHERDYHREFVARAVSFFHTQMYLQQGTQLIRLDVPADAIVNTFKDQIIVRLRSDWEVSARRHPAGAVLTMPWNAFLEGKREFQSLFTPGPRTSFAGLTITRNRLILNELDNVRNRLHVLSAKDGQWQRQALQTPQFGSISVSAYDELESDDYFLTSSDFVTPSTLYLGSLSADESKADATPRTLLKQLPAFFNADNLQVSQHEAMSPDGTRVPYFQVARRNVKLDGTNPTLLYGYGGFQLSSLPGYNSAVGLSWLEQGGVYVVANIRGGGEFGPTWHQAALKANRQRAYDDFIAVAQDLIARKVTSPKHLGVMGGSNGGLLTGVMLTQRPELFGAVVSQVPLLDMRRYHKLLAGASWMAEYGDPDKAEQWQYISKYSPYHNLAKDRQYPRVLFTTSTRDDRVHPGHARKMTARMKEQGHDVLLYENIEGGHGGAANNRQQAFMNALAYTFLLRQLQ